MNKSMNMNMNIEMDTDMFERNNYSHRISEFNDIGFVQKPVSFFWCPDKHFLYIYIPYSILV
jgi:hypothetical protein